MRPYFSATWLRQAVPCAARQSRRVGNSALRASDIPPLHPGLAVLLGASEGIWAVGHPACQNKKSRLLVGRNKQRELRRMCYQHGCRCED
ncbi:hypothetical protein SAMN02745857_01174 [Andreprevotia lacus DSM 23236]|jgi:hypothetical protein|uniref:Uncharacterized protein n=1 Tax=Andreprevotia lacus DSM 23236 TaxID=1121001 RepID=A0A1W1XBL1_9NEIS|nr:hypothetical protein SAMN02745857_01174 [Andreprevotia lacus DSM 23236]